MAAIEDRGGTPRLPWDLRLSFRLADVANLERLLAALGERGEDMSPIEATGLALAIGWKVVAAKEDAGWRDPIREIPEDPRPRPPSDPEAIRAFLARFPPKPQPPPRPVARSRRGHQQRREG
jgi:hypothetical protein